MPTDQLLQQMLTTVIDGNANILKRQDSQDVDIKDIRSSMTELIKIDAELVSQRSAFERIGKHLDKVESQVNKNYTEIHGRINKIDEMLTEVRIVSARTVVKVTLIAAGASTIMTGVLGLVLVKLTT